MHHLAFRSSSIVIDDFIRIATRVYEPYRQDIGLSNVWIAVRHRAESAALSR
jgi:hypothetical protein